MKASVKSKKNLVKKNSEKIALENRIKALELELSVLKSLDFKKPQVNEQRFRLATEASGVGIWEWNVITSQIKWDAKMFEIYGVNPTNNGFVQYDTWKQAVVPEDIEEQEKILQNTLKNSSSSKRSFKILRANDGILRYIEASETVRTNDTGQTEWIIGTNIDVTEKVLARKKIEESEHRYHDLVYTSPYMIAIFKGKDTIIEIANDAIIETWGKGKDVFGKSLFEVIPEAAEQGFDKLMQNVYETGEPYHAYETPVTLIRNGKQELMHYNFIYQAQRNIDGEIVGVAILANEVTPKALLKKALAEQREIEQKALKSIEESNTRYHNILMQSPFAFSVMKGKDMVVTLANDLMKEFWGKGMEVEGKTLLEILPELQDQPFPEMINQVFITGQSIYANEILAQLKYNEKLEDKYFNIVYQPYYEADSSIAGVTTIAYDVTEMVVARKKIEQSEAHFRLLADLMPAKINNATPEGSATYFNKHWLEFSGYNFQELKDFGYHQLMHPDEIEEFQQRFQKAAETGTDLVMEMRFKNTHGNYIWHLNMASPVKDAQGNLEMWIGVTTEMQHQKEQREKLEQAVAARTYELKKANASLVDKNMELKNMVKELEAFTYVSSHDLQEPLRKIQIFASRILEKENQNLTDSGKNYLHIMQNAAERMQILIQDLLAFSHLSTSDRKFENTNLNIIIDEVRKEFQDAIAEKKAVIEVAEICEIKIIPFQFRQLMHNLISNALKFSNPNIPPHIKISIFNLTYNEIHVENLPPNKAYCHIIISDNGIGFEKEYAEKIFEVFQKLHSKDDYAGTGIGLAIVKKIVDNHDGMITATSELKKGTTFNIYIPA